MRLITDKLINKLSHAIIFVGILLRLREYFANRSLWVDEALLALNIIQRSYRELLEPLSANQYAPVGFLYVEHTLSKIFDGTELALRLFPLISGILAIWFFKKLADQFFTPKYSLLALSLFAFSDILIRYSTEVKQYSTEVLVGIILYLFFLKKEPNSAKKWLMTIFVGFLSLLFSHAAIFRIFTVGVVEFFASKKKLEWGTYTVILAVLFILLYGHDASSAYRDSSFLNEWSYFHLLFFYPPFFLDNLRIFWSMITQILGPISAWFGATLAFFGGYSLIIKKEFRKLTLLVMPFCLALVASGFQKYPFTLRTFLFSVPFLTILIVKGLEFVHARLSSELRNKLTILLFLALVFNSCLVAIVHVVSPRQVEELRPVEDFYESHKQPNDLTYVYYAADAPFHYYAWRYQIPLQNLMIGGTARKNWHQYLTEIESMHRPGQRFWIIFSHVIVGTYTNYGPLSEEDYIVNFLNSEGGLITSYHAIGASAYLYQW
ncbi:MAG TPA: glycosyltransferase family 39 protein [Patescibacteria group bacterium]|nr:glycosyltransferase family 39 protein [Patescibacteria group bacterium]